ncbi:15238_t:CDS:2 [Entrophospora sp. SA101]|nr:15238_t:CDS:2 [Entrophospora sp. SA101]
MEPIKIFVTGNLICKKLTLELLKNHELVDRVIDNKEYDPDL